MLDAADAGHADVTPYYAAVALAVADMQVAVYHIVILAGQVPDTQHIGWIWEWHSVAHHTIDAAVLAVDMKAVQLVAD